MPSTSTPTPTQPASRGSVEKFENCPKCGFKFPKPQAKCNSDVACQRRQDAKKAGGAPPAAKSATSSKTTEVTAVNALSAAAKDPRFAAFKKANPEALKLGSVEQLAAWEAFCATESAPAEAAKPKAAPRKAS